MTLVQFGKVLIDNGYPSNASMSIYLTWKVHTFRSRNSAKNHQIISDELMMIVCAGSLLWKSLSKNCSTDIDKICTLVNYSNGDVYFRVYIPDQDGRLV